MTGRDADESRVRRALELGAIDASGDGLDAALVVVATPAGQAAAVACHVLAEEGRNPDVVVTDVSGVKVPVVEAVRDPRFVGGHPMAGSEQSGIDGADPDLFVGATWVLTPTVETDAAAYTLVSTVVTELGAEVVALSPADHDRLVAVVSHVPHLVAATLMNAAAEGAEADGALLRLAAGGFRDMTRVAAGQPTIWPDICAENADAIVAGLDRLLVDLGELRDKVARGGPQPGCSRCSGGRARPGGSCRRGPPGRTGWRSCGCRCPTAKGCWPSSPASPATSASTSTTSRSPTPQRVREACSPCWSTSRTPPGSARRSRSGATPAQ